MLPCIDAAGLPCAGKTRAAGSVSDHETGQQVSAQHTSTGSDVTCLLQTHTIYFWTPIVPLHLTQRVYGSQDM